MKRLLLILAAGTFLFPGNALAAAHTVTVTGNTESGAMVSVNGITAQVTGTTFSASVPLEYGTNTMTAVATDAAGNSGSASVTVQLGSKINVQGTVDSSVTTVAVLSGAGSNVTVTPSAGNFSALVTLVLGINTITVNAGDAAGNTNTAARQVFLARPPVDHP